jgi:hypothetical protein
MSSPGSVPEDEEMMDNFIATMGVTSPSSPNNEQDDGNLTEVDPDGATQEDILAAEQAPPPKKKRKRKHPVMTAEQQIHAVSVPSEDGEVVVGIAGH